MPKTGDRVIVEGNKVGQLRREGTLLGTIGKAIRVRWADGSETLFTPGAGSVTFEAGTSKNGPTKRPAPAAKKPAVKSGKSPGRAKAPARSPTRSPGKKKATKKR